MSVGSRFAFTLVSSLVAAVSLAGCDVDTPLKEIGDAQHLAADLSVQFSKALDASNLAVMAGSDDTSKTYAGVARQRTAAAQKDVDALRFILERRGFTEELQLLEEFRQRFN